MKKTVKATVSVILSAIILFSLAAPGYARTNAKITPTILVAGQGATLKTKDGEEVYPLNFKVDAAFVGKAFLKLNPGFTKGYLTGDYSDYCDAVCELIDPIFEPIRLDNNGNCPHGYVPKKGLMLNSKEKIYRFNYDWRLDPLETADKLDEYIDTIMAKNGVNKVNLIGRCLGANVVTSYIHKYGVDKLDKFIIYCGVLWGTELCGDLFSGKFNVDPDGVENYVLNSTGDDLVMSILKETVSLFNRTGGLDLTADFVNDVYGKIKDDLIPRLIMLIFGTMPSYWSMLPPDEYDEAKAFIFSDGREEEYAGLIEKIDNYHNTIQLRGEEILKDAQAKGLQICNICKYGRVLTPVVADTTLNADEMVSVYYSSLGATAAGYNKTLDEEYIQNAEQNGKGKYISPDKQIDASTCMFPDTTWFVKNVGHRTFPSCIEDDLMIPYLRYNGKMTVETNEDLPQFLVCDEKANTIRPMTEENSKTEKVNNDSVIFIVVRLIVDAVKLLISKIKK